MKYKELSDYLTENSVFGFTATIRKNVIIYKHNRFFNGMKLHLKVKVNQATKEVLSVMNNGVIYKDFEDVKKLVERKG